VQQQHPSCVRRKSAAWRCARQRPTTVTTTAGLQRRQPLAVPLIRTLRLQPTAATQRRAASVIEPDSSQSTHASSPSKLTALSLSTRSSKDRKACTRRRATRAWATTPPPPHHTLHAER
jgi:hypothetical protein